MQAQGKKVVIIGGGLSGLTTAQNILKNSRNQKIEVTVLQSMDRVGGRTCTTQVQNCKFDLGGQWVGKTQSHVQQLAKRAGNDLVEQWHTGTKILHFGSKISTYKTNIPLNVGILALIHMQTNIWKLERMANKLNPDNPRENCSLAMLWDSITMKTWMDQNIYFAKINLLMECAVRAIFGVQTDQVSFLFVLWYIRQNGGLQNLINIQNGLQQFKMKHGSQYLSQFLRKNIEQMGGKVLLNSSVRKIVQNSEGQKFEKITVYFGEKQSIECDYVVIAMPPARVRKIQFYPQLSRERRMICDRNIMGSISKVHILYQQAYWRDKGFSGQTLSDCVETAMFNAYDDTKIKQNGEVQPAILIFINASVNRQWSQSENRHFAQKNILETLSRYFNEPNMLRPQKVHWKTWDDEPSLNGGPIAVFPPGVLTKISNIRKPEGRIHWAGTQMARKSQGFMDGAIESGERVAEEILNNINGLCSEQEQKPQIPTTKWYSSIINAKHTWFQWL